MGIFSLLTGRYPSELIRNTKSPPAFSKAMRTLPETLERARYQNAAFVDDQLLDESFGYSQGFTVWDNLAMTQKRKRGRRKKSNFAQLIERLDQHLSSLSLARESMLLYGYTAMNSQERSSRSQAVSQLVLRKRRSRKSIFLSLRSSNSR